MNRGPFLSYKGPLDNYEDVNVQTSIALILILPSDR